MVAIHYSIRKKYPRQTIPRKELKFFMGKILHIDKQYRDRVLEELECFGMIKRINRDYITILD